MLGHVELAGHVAVLHEGVVQPLPAPCQEFGVVRLSVHPRHAAQQAGVVRTAVHVTGQFAVARHVAVQAGARQSALTLQLVQVGGALAHPGGLLGEVKHLVAALGGGGDVLNTETVNT